MKKISLYKTEGIILRKADLNETDRLFVIYSKEYGKMLLRAKGVRKNESKLRGYLELFNYNKFLIAKSKTIDIITNVEPIETFPNLRNNLEALAAAFYGSEIIDRLIVGPEKEERIWQLIYRFFRALETKSTPTKKLIPLFEDKFLLFLGYGSQIERRQKDNQKFIQSLVDREIRSAKFLKQLGLKCL